MWLDNFDLNYKCSIRRREFVNDSYCNQIVSCTTLVKNEPCAIWLGGGPDVLIGDRIHNPKSYTLVIKPNIAYQATDRIIINGSSYAIGEPHNVANEDAIMVFNLESIE